jgi:hypothetical protein
MKGTPRIKEVKPLDNMVLSVLFENNIAKQYDVKPLLNKYPAFADLKNKHLFNLVTVGPGGYGVIWNDQIDLSEYEIWKNGKTVN